MCENIIKQNKIVHAKFCLKKQLQNTFAQVHNNALKIYSRVETNGNLFGFPQFYELKKSFTKSLTNNYNLR